LPAVFRAVAWQTFAGQMPALPPVRLSFGTEMTRAALANPQPVN
jgi:hypothetical protein